MIDFADCVGISEHTLAQGIAIWPNPASGMVNVRLNGLDADRIVMILADMSGRIMLEHQQNVNLPEEEFLLDISALNPGVYLLRAVAGPSIWYGKIAVYR